VRSLQLCYAALRACGSLEVRQEVWASRLSPESHFKNDPSESGSRL
jgi:hypothetical protein